MLYMYTEIFKHGSIIGRQKVQKEILLRRCKKPKDNNIDSN